jgi:RNA polymerase primary sigma factor
LLNRVRRIRQALQQELGRAPTNEEIADKLGMPAEKYAKIIKLTRRSISLEMPKYQNNPKDVGQESEKLVLDTIDATAVVSDEHRPERSVDQRLFRSDLCEMLKILEEDERRVICSRYGLGEYER